VRQIRRDIARIQTISRQKVADGGEAKAAPKTKTKTKAAAKPKAAAKAKTKKKG